MKPSLFGYGTTTKSLAKSGGWNIFDDSFKQITHDKYNNTLYPSSHFSPQKSSLEIVSPGFLPTHPLVTNAQHLMSEYDYFFNNSPDTIWISGTNGKTTTTGMLHHLLRTNGALVGGNYGIPLASLDINAPLWILETSSFTMHYTHQAHPFLYALLPITPDHLNWHKDFKEYEKSKLSVLKRMDKNSVVLLPQKYKDYPTKAFVVTYENEKDLAQYFSIDLNSIIFKEPFLLDAMLALACQYILLGKADIKRLNTFIIDRHKMEELHDSKGRLWVNDTKGTNDDATIAAVKRYAQKHIHLILGGVDKKLDNTLLFDFLQTIPHLTIYAIGELAPVIIKEANKRSLHVIHSQDIQSAVKGIDVTLNLGDVALLSPATSSFDQFDSYKQRGDFFIECISKL